MIIPGVISVPSHITASDLLLAVHQVTMLAQAGRRYLLSIFSSAHNIAAVGAGEVSFAIAQPSHLLQAFSAVRHVCCCLPLTSLLCLLHCAGVQQLPAAQPDLHLSVSRLVSTTAGPAAEGSGDAPNLQQQQQQRQDGVLPASQADEPQLFSDDSFTSASDPILQPAQQPNIAAVGPRKVDPSRFGGSKGPGPKREGVVHVNSTFNNTHLVLTDRSSKVETWVSGGTVGYKNANKVCEYRGSATGRRGGSRGHYSTVQSSAVVVPGGLIMSQHR